MKNICLFLLLVSTFCACKSIPMGNKPLPNPRPFVKLTDGTKIEATTVDEHLTRIQADGVGYKKSDVRSFSDGAKTYMLTPSDKVAERIFEGKLNIYKYSFLYTTTSYSSTGGSSTHTHKHVEQYFEKEGTDTFRRLNYKNLAMVIKPKLPSFQYLAASKRSSRIGTYKFIGIIGSVVGGIALIAAATNGGKTNTAIGVAGVSLFIPGTFYLYISGLRNKLKSARQLEEAVGSYNDVYPAKKGRR